MDNLYSAVPAVVSPVLSGQTFQMLLSTWLDEKGILSELRSQLRFKMINALRGTAVGKNVNKSDLKRTSLYAQAINTVIAEFLIQNKCYYSLSVFNTEVSLSQHTLPGFSVIDHKTKTLKEEYHLDKESILNIMELIGIIKTSIYCEEIVTLYFHEQEYNSLLHCIINVLGKLTNKPNSLYNLHLDISTRDLNVGNNFMKQIENLLSLSGLNDKNLQTVMQNIIILYDAEKKVRKEKFCDEKKQMKKIIKNNKILKKQLLKITNDYKKLLLNSKKLVVREQITKRSYMQEGINKQNLSSDLKRNNSVASEVTRNQHNVICQLQHCSEICKNNQMMNEDLIKQNKNLIQETEQQRNQVNKLTLKYNQLVCEFTECQQKVALLNSKLNQDHSEQLLANILYENISALPVHLGKHIETSEVNSSTYNYNNNTIREEIVCGTRLKLKQLEKETNRIEEKCKLLHSNNLI